VVAIALSYSVSLCGKGVIFQVSNTCRPLVRKKAALCLLRLYRKNPDVVNVEGW